jgi:hypothetical protein
MKTSKSIDNAEMNNEFAYSNGVTLQSVDGVSSSMDDLAECVVKDPMLVAKLNALGFKSKNPNGMTYKEAIMCSQIANAVKGDLRSYKAVVEMMRQDKTPPIVGFFGNGQRTVMDITER